MNKERLKKARDYLVNKVDPSMFDTKYFRNGGQAILECKTIGNVIGHLTALDDKFKTDLDYFRYEDGNIKFKYWAMTYFEISELEFIFIVSYCFATYFPKYTNEQLLAHTIERIDYVIKYGRVPHEFLNNSSCKKFSLGFSKSVSEKEKIK